MMTARRRRRGGFRICSGTVVSSRQSSFSITSAAEAVPLRDRLTRLRAEHPLRPATGGAADKAFFDTLSGET